MKIAHTTLKGLAKRYGHGNRGIRKNWMRTTAPVFAVAMDAVEAGERALAISVLLEVVHLRDAYWLVTDGGVATDSDSVDGRHHDTPFTTTALFSTHRREHDASIESIAARMAQNFYAPVPPSHVLMSRENYDALRVHLGGVPMNVITDPNVPRDHAYLIPFEIPHAFHIADPDGDS